MVGGLAGEAAETGGMKCWPSPDNSPPQGPFCLDGLRLPSPTLVPVFGINVQLEPFTGQFLSATAEALLERLVA